ncbi:hypothetical protein [Candidatus Bandiella euplotis]|nr:hypothetical protein [Candidatus Bandiella woodruffii]
MIFNGIGSLIKHGLSGGDFGSGIGKIASTFLRQSLDRYLWSNSYYASYDGKRLEQINVQTVKYGKDIPIIGSVASVI